MMVRKCDSCGKEIEKVLQVMIGGFGGSVEFCEECAQPVVKFLNEKQLLQDKLERYGFKKEAEEVS